MCCVLYLDIPTALNRNASVFMILLLCLTLTSGTTLMPSTSKPSSSRPSTTFPSTTFPSTGTPVTLSAYQGHTPLTHSDDAVNTDDNFAHVIQHSFISIILLRYLCISQCFLTYFTVCILQCLTWFYHDSVLRYCIIALRHANVSYNCSTLIVTTLHCCHVSKLPDSSIAITLILISTNRFET